MALSLRHLSSTLLSPYPPLIISSFHFQSSLRNLRCHSSKRKETSFTDRILDYIEGGPKLRKWYGAPDLLPKDGGGETEEDENPEDEGARDAVLVSDGESEIGQMVILLLILRRARVKALVKNKRAAMDAYGTYVEAMAGDINDKGFLVKTLRGVRAIICASNDGFFSAIGRMKGVQHVVLLSQLAVYRGSSGVMAIMNSNTKKLAERDEETVLASGIPYTIIRVGLLQNTPGGKQGFIFEEGSAARGKLSKEDAAFVCVEALDAIPRKGLVFEVANGEQKVSNWKEWFATMLSRTEELS